MNLAATAPAWVLVILGVLLAAAAVEDSIRLRISNLTSAGVLIAALVAMALAGFPAALWQNAAVLAGLLFVGTLIFAAGQIGGGDVKLLAALGAWMNLQGALWLLVSVFLAGGVLALGFIAVRLLRGRGFKRRSDKAGGIPYGLAIVAGACIVVASQLGKL